MQSPFNYGGAPIADRVSLALPPPSSARAERLFFPAQVQAACPKLAWFDSPWGKGISNTSTILEFPELGKNRRIVQESEARPIFYTGPGAGCLGEEPPGTRSGAATTPAKLRKKKTHGRRWRPGCQGRLEVSEPPSQHQNVQLLGGGRSAL